MVSQDIQDATVKTPSTSVITILAKMEPYVYLNRNKLYVIVFPIFMENSVNLSMMNVNWEIGKCN